MKLRLAYIEALIVIQDKVGRQDLQDMFRLGSAVVSRDFAKYHKLCPGNLQYDLIKRHYRASPTFKPQVLTTSANEFLVNLLALEDYF